MQVKADLLVLGAKFFAGAVDGQSHDSTKLFVAMPVADKNAEKYGRVGYEMVEIKFGRGDEYQRLKTVPFPITAELDLKLTAAGYECVAFKALNSARPQQA